MAHPRQFPVGFKVHTFPNGYMGQTLCPDAQTCPYCDRTEAVWRADPANPSPNLLALLSLIRAAQPGVEWPKGSGTVPFPTAGDFTLLKVRAFVQAVRTALTSG